MVADIFRLNLDGIQIRRVRYSDLGDVIFVNRKTLPENYSLQLFLTMYRNYKDIFWVAEDVKRNHVIGYCMNKMEYRTKSFFGNQKVTKGHIFSIGVLPDYRRRGIATALLAFSIKSMIERDCSEMFLEVRVSNEPAQKLYKKFRFEVVARVPRYYADGEDAYIFAVKKEVVEPIIDHIIGKIHSLKK